MSVKIEEEFPISKTVLMDTQLNASDLRVYVITRIKVKEHEALGKEFAPETTAYAASLGIHSRTLQHSLLKLENKGYILREFKNKKRIIHV